MDDSDRCKACSTSPGCNETVCVAFNDKAQTFASVCEAVKELHDKTEVVVILFALGDCSSLLSSEGKNH